MNRLTREGIRDKYALPSTPKYIYDAELDTRTYLRLGEANSVEGWGKGGGKEYDLIRQRIGNLSNERELGQRYD